MQTSRMPKPYKSYAGQHPGLKGDGVSFGLFALSFPCCIFVYELFIQRVTGEEV